MTRIAFTADLHVDEYPYGGTDPATGINRRELDFLRTTAWVAEQAREQGAEALVVAGDYTESKVPPKAPRVARIARALEGGPDRQIHLTGNHDGAHAGDSIVTVLARRPGWSGHMRPAVEVVGDVAICVIPYLSTAWLRVQEGFEAVSDAEVYRILGEQYLTIARGLFVEAGRTGAAAAILVGHQQLSGGRMTDKQAAFLGDLDVVVDTRALAAIGYAAVVFGHVHRAQLVLDESTTGCPVMFVGSPERVDFAEENEEKSFLVVDFEGGRLTHLERIPTLARRFYTIDGPGYEVDRVAGAVVRVIDVNPEADPAHWRRMLEGDGAFAVTEIRRRPVEAAAAANRIAEGLTPQAALEVFFEGDPDAEALIERGRQILAEVA